MGAKFENHLNFHVHICTFFVLLRPDANATYSQLKRMKVNRKVKKLSSSSCNQSEKWINSESEMSHLCALAQPVQPILFALENENNTVT